MTTKQEEIREGVRVGIDLFADDRCLYPDKACAWCDKQGYCGSEDDSYICLMKRLGELSAVLKVERELPNSLHTEAFIGDNQLEILEKILKEAGFVATGPFIEE